MSIALTIGNISLNISFFLYLILYLPQIIHNRQSTHIAHLSLSTHFLLYLSYCFDLFYGVANHLPWQYKTVSFVGLSLVIVQHLQLTQFLFRKKAFFSIYFNLFCFGLTILGNYYFFVRCHGELTEQITLIVGSIARFCGLIYCLPQVLKNKRSQSATAISTPFVYLNLCLALLDMISAWCLDWGWPNKLASPLTIIIMLTILFQIKHYAQPRPAGTLTTVLD